MPVLPFDVNTAIKLGHFVQDAYRIRTASDPDKFQPSTPGYQRVHTLYANDLFDTIDGYVPFGLIAQATAAPNDIVVAVRGTEGLFEWLKNAEFLLISCPIQGSLGQSEQGFSDLYTTLRIGPDDAALPAKDALRQLVAANPGVGVSISGHSLGGALVTLLTLDLVLNAGVPQPTVYTFASPAVGDKTFAGQFDTLLPTAKRIANGTDIVPHLPPFLMGYVHVDTLFPINSDDSTKNTIVCHHSLETYLHTLRASEPLDANCRSVAGQNAMPLGDVEVLAEVALQEAEAIAESGQ